MGYTVKKDEVEFVIYIINEISNKCKKSTSRVYDVLEKTGCIQTYLVPFYDVLHTLGTERITSDVLDFVSAKGESI